MIRIFKLATLVFISLFFVSFNSNNSISILSWNLFDFGKTKSDAEISFIAKTMKDYDIVAIQEVVAKDPGGAQAVARLAVELNRTGSKWDYRVSDPTTGTGNKSERYAFFWKTSRAKLLGRAWLEQKYNLEIDREPYFATFEANGKQFTLSDFHAITSAKHPETEIAYFKLLPAEYPSLHLIFMGDFNCSQSNEVFTPLKNLGYQPVLIGKKTSLKRECNGNDCLASEFDNIFLPVKYTSQLSSGTVEFYKNFPSLDSAKHISDHIPIYVAIGMNP